MLRNQQCQECARHCRSSGTHVQQGGLLSAESKASNDGRAKRSDTAIGETSGNQEQEDHVETDVEEGLLELRPGEPPHLSTGLVLTDTLQSNDLLILSEPFSIRWRCSKEEPEYNSHKEREGAIEDEETLPSEALGLVDAPCEEASEDVRPARGGVPDGSSCDLFGLGIERAGDIDHSRGCAHLNGTKQKSDSCKASEIVANCVHCDNKAPDHAHSSEVLGQGDALHEVCCRNFASQITKAFNTVSNGQVSSRAIYILDDRA